MGLPVAVDLSDAAVTAAASRSDLGVVVSYGELIGPELLDRLPMVNVHFSLLPRWRGAAPVQRAILAGDSRTGVCLMEVVAELDAGGVYRTEVTPIQPDETAAELQGRLCEIGTRLLLEALQAPLGVPQPQEGPVSYAGKVAAAELRIDWSRPAERIHRLVRVGGAWTTLRGKRLKIIKAQRHPSMPGVGAGTVAGVSAGGVLVAAGRDVLELQVVQAAGRAATSALSWRNGARIVPGDQLGA